MKNDKFHHISKFLLTWIFVCGVTYSFLSLCNWSIAMKGWNGFSRFLLAVEGIMFIINLFEEL